MRAITQQRYGGTEALAVSDVPTPAPGPGEVLLRVRAAGVDRGTWHLMTGEPYLMRLALGFRGPRQSVLGRDVAGVVEAVGADVTSFAVGDEVMGTADGSFAEHAVVPVRRLAHKPAATSFEEAAVLPISGGTALQAVRDAGRLQPGQRVLVLGASGGVGSYAVQVAAALGGEVTGVASGTKADFVRSLGATHVLDYRRDDLADHGPWDLVVDLAGQRPVRQLRRLLTSGGTLVVAGGEGGRWLGGVQRQLVASLLSPFVGQRLLGLLSRERAATYADLADLVDRGAVRPQLDRTFALDEAAKAIDHLAAGHVRGKVALVV